MTSIQGHNYLCKKCFFVAFYDSFSLSRLDDKLFDQTANQLDPPSSNFLIAKFSILKYTKKDL